MTRKIARRSRRNADELKPIEHISIVAKYLNGTGAPALANEYGTTRSAILTTLKRAQVPARDPTTANQIIASRRTREQNLAYVKKARATRLKNLREASYDPLSKHPAVGAGYALIVQRMTDVGLTHERQVKIGPYYVDVVMNGVAIEIDFRGGHTGFSVRTKKFKYFADRPQPLIHIVFDGAASLDRDVDKIITLLDEASRDPPARGEYWVIRCNFKYGFSCTKDDKRAAVARPKGSKRSIIWID